MSIELSPEFAQFVEQQIALGRFHDATEVVEAGLSSLRQENEAIRSAVDPAIAQLDRGERHVFDSQEIRRLGLERLAATRSSES